jgi:hypothetical protein
MFSFDNMNENKISASYIAELVSLNNLIWAYVVLALFPLNQYKMHTILHYSSALHMLVKAK